MQKRPLGQTGLTIAPLGFGAMRLPMTEGQGEAHIDEDKAIPLLHHALERGVNYIDTAYFYCNFESELVVGKALRGAWREKAVLSTKMPLDRIKKPGDPQALLDMQQERLGVECIDLYHLHALSWEFFASDLGQDALKTMQRARDEGRIGHIAFSSHDTPENAMRLIDTGEFASVLLQYNLLDRQYAPALARAAACGMGALVMGPVAGGQLAPPSDLLCELHHELAGESTPEIALRYVLGNGDVTAALSGMDSIEMLEQNIAVAEGATVLTPQARSEIEERLSDFLKRKRLYCTGCNYCMPCPAGVQIPAIFWMMSLQRVYGLQETAQRGYASLVERAEGDGSAAACTGCGVCEGKCPQSIAIREQLAECDQLLR